jgi:methionine-rich copper-binding protein CopC
MIIKKRMSRFAFAALFLGASTLGLAGPAVAHTDLVSVTAVTELELTFTEPVELAFSEVTIRDGNGTEVPQEGELTLKNGDNTTAVIQLVDPLPPGTYQIEWSIVSADGHKATGTFAYESVE